MTDRLFPTPAPRVLLLIAHLSTVPHVHLHLESRRRFFPDVPVIVHDDCRDDSGPLRELCAAYGAHYFAPPEPIGQEALELSSCLLAVQSAQQVGADLAVKMSSTFVPLADWVPQLQHLAHLTQYATYSNQSRGEAVGFRGECVAFHAPSWSSEGSERRLERAVESGPETFASVGEFLHHLAREVHAGTQCAANAAYESLYPRSPALSAYGSWSWMGDDGTRRLPSALWQGSDATLDYYRLALAYGLDYRYEDFLDPEALLDPRADQARAGEVLAATVARRPMRTGAHEARVFTHEQGNFAEVTGENVLIYMPHGFGDWVQFSYVLPLLDPSNRYFMTRFGDDSISVLEGSDYAAPLYCGHNSPNCDDGGGFRNRHFGLEYEEIDGSVKTLDLPLSLYQECRRHDIRVVYWTNLPDPWGEAPFPYHTKARVQLPYMVAPERLAQTDLTQPLRSGLSFQSSPWLIHWVESRLTSFGGFGQRKLCLITRNGYTTIGKNWGHLFRDEVPGRRLREGQECRDFMRLLLRKDPDWMFLVMEDQFFEGDDTVRSEALHAYSYAELFGSMGGYAPPFGLVMKALVSLADLSVGIPAGPYHLSMLREDLPTVGLWIDQLPCWYDEPKAASIHLISRNVRDRGHDKRPGSFAERAGLRYQMRWLETRRIPGEQVLSAVESLLA